MEDIRAVLSAGGDAQLEFLYFIDRIDRMKKNPVFPKNLSNEITVSHSSMIQDAERRADECLRKLDNVARVISSVGYSTYADILTLRYIHRQNWKTIRDELSKQGTPYSLRSIYRLHDKALAAAEVVWKEQSNDGR